jgi:hypothetical protein
MSASPYSQQPTQPDIPPEQHASAWAFSSFIFASAVMIMGGLFQMAAGLGAILDNGFFFTAADYAYDLDVAIWGWLHLAGGTLLLLAGFYIFKGAAWARLVGIVAAILSAAILFLFIPVYPVWALLIIAIDIVIIWSLTTYGRELAEDS